MALTSSNNLLTSLLSAGSDSLSNLFLVSFSGIGTNYIEDVDQDLQVRCQGFTPPNTSQDSYQVRFINAYIDLPAAKVNVDRSFSITFRVDADHEILKALEDQMGATFNPQNGYTSTDISYIMENGFTVSVSVINQALTLEDQEEYSTTELFKFYGCWIKHIPSINYNTSTAQAATVTVDFGYLKLEDLASGITGSSDPMTLGTI